MNGGFFPQAINLLFRSAAWRIKLTPVNFWLARRILLDA